MACIACGRGFCGECGDPCCCSSSQSESLPFSSLDTGEPKQRGRPKKPDNQITTSAGRKRAAVLFPIDPNSPCDWQGLANCGGGKFPIIGCLRGKQEERHHGPVKDTYRNEDTNVHCICDNCHNLWHAKNDPVYNKEEYELLPHSPRPSTPAEKLERGL